jgi:hypothetical protein
MRIRPTIAFIVIVLAIFANTRFAPAGEKAVDPRVQAYINYIQHVTKSVYSLGVKYIVSHQNENGSYGANSETAPGVTGAVLQALVDSQFAYRETDGPYVSRAVEYLLSQQKPDGSFGGRFNTLYALRGLKALQPYGNRDYGSVIDRAEAALAKMDGEPVATGKYGEILRSVIEPHLAANKRIMEGKDRLAGVARQLVKEQRREDDTDSGYGSFVDPDASRLEHDPVLATAMAARIADLIRRRYADIE